MSEAPRVRSVRTDGKNITVLAPLIRSSVTYPAPEPTIPSILGTMQRHLKGVMASIEELRALFEKEERRP